MAYAYTAWASQPTVAEKIAMLEQHIAEVSLAIGGQPDVAADSKSVSYASSQGYLNWLTDRLDYYTTRLPGTNGRRSYARFNRPGA